jgi:hypothetical protein
VKVRERLASWVREQGMTHPGISPNHAWRHLFKTCARRAAIEASIRDAIVGHAPRSIGVARGAAMGPMGFQPWPVGRQAAQGSVGPQGARRAAVNSERDRPGALAKLIEVAGR